MKHIPKRTCIVCRQVKSKHELVRLVRLPTGVIEVDANGRKPGRGAYLCWSSGCWESGLKGGRLEHYLATTLSRQNREQLVKFGQALSQGEVDG